MTELTRLIVTVGPTSLPLSLNEIKAHLGLEDSETRVDPLLMGYLRSAVGHCETFTRRALITQTLTLYRDGWESGAGDEPLTEGWSEGPSTLRRAAYLELPRPPLQSVAWVKTYDDSDAATIWPSTGYFVDNTGTPGRIVPRVGQAWPSVGRAANGIEIRYLAGYGDSGDRVPQAIRDGLLAFIGQLHDCGGTQDAAEAARASGAHRLWQPFRFMGL